MSLTQIIRTALSLSLSHRQNKTRCQNISTCLLDTLHLTAHVFDTSELICTLKVTV